MAKKGTKRGKSDAIATATHAAPPAHHDGRPDTRVIYCGDNLERPAKLPAALALSAQRRTE
jgi:hypothetical protein